jgi:hypothetical protein
VWWRANAAEASGRRGRVFGKARETIHRLRIVNPRVFQAFLDVGQRRPGFSDIRAIKPPSLWRERYHESAKQGKRETGSRNLWAVHEMPSFRVFALSCFLDLLNVHSRPSACIRGSVVLSSARSFAADTLDCRPAAFHRKREIEPPRCNA